YNQNIPQPTDQLSQSQADLLNNFQAIYTLIGVNHTQFNAGNQGTHAFVEMPVQNPVPVTVGNEVGLYCQLSTLTGNPELVFSHQNGTGIVEFTSSTQALLAGWSKIPSGILFKWGQVSINPGANTVVFPVNATTPAFANAFNVQLTPLGGVGSTYNIYLTTLNNLQFTVASNAGAPITIHYFVTGN